MIGQVSLIGAGCPISRDSKYGLMGTPRRPGQAASCLSRFLNLMARWVVKRNPISYSRFESRLRAIRVLRTATPFLRRPLFSELERVCDVSLDLRFVLIFRHPGMVPRNF